MVAGWIPGTGPLRKRPYYISTTNGPTFASLGNVIHEEIAVPPQVVEVMTIVPSISTCGLKNSHLNKVLLPNSIIIIEYL